VAGIPILKKGAVAGGPGRARQSTDDVIAQIEAGRYREALLTLMSPASPALAPAWMWSLPSVKGIGRLKGLAHKWALRGWLEEAAALLTDRGGQVMACDLLDFYFRQSGLKKMDTYDYFAFRFGQPRHLVGLSFASLIHAPKKPILDLACGFGHLTRSLVQQARGQPVIGVDDSFFGLYVAKHWIAPDAEYVCCTTEASLPFPDGAFSAAFCSDAFHYFVNKVTCIRELDRLTQDDGLIMVVWIHNALLRRPYDGRPLPPEDYRTLVAHMPHCLVADSDVLARYLQKQGPPLTRSADIGHLAHAPSLSVVASHQQNVFQDYGPFTDWPHAEGRLGLNPLYVEETRDGLGNVHLRRTFPSAFYEKENAEGKEYLPEAVTVHSAIVADLAQGKRTSEMEGLIEQCIILDIPERYRRP
jgi:ubiquinone/menaquinone biosynthesis C-methylase UbiE